MTYETVQSFTGSVVASFHTASQANTRSNPVMFFKTARLDTMTHHAHLVRKRLMIEKQKTGTKEIEPRRVKRLSREEQILRPGTKEIVEMLTLKKARPMRGSSIVRAFA